MGNAPIELSLARILMEYRLTVERHPERKYEHWLFLNRGKGRSKIPIAQWMNGIISAHPYHSAHDISIQNSAQLLVPDHPQKSDYLYIVLYQVESHRGQNNTTTRCFRIETQLPEIGIEEIPVSSAPTKMNVLGSI